MPYQVRQPASAGRGLTLPTLALAAAALIAIAAPVLPSPAHAQAYPVKPIRMIVNFPPGGGTDVTARLIQPWLTKELGQQILDLRPDLLSTVLTMLFERFPTLTTTPSRG